MPVPTSLSDLSTTASNNSPAGNESARGTIDDYFRAHAKFIADVNDAKLAKAGGTMTGAITLAGDASSALHAVPKQQLEAVAAAVKEALYPVGSIYINATNATNPGTLLGFGTWTAFGAGRVPVGFNSGDSNFNAAEKTGGSKDAIVVSHTHTFSATTNTTGSHAHVETHYFTNGNGDGLGPGAGCCGGAVITSALSTLSAGDHQHTVSGTTASTGSSGTNANLQPFITVYMWKRTA
jgi:hypothetical protein